MNRAAPQLPMRVLRGALLLQSIGVAWWWFRDGTTIAATVGYEAVGVGMAIAALGLGILATLKPSRVPLVALFVLMFVEPLVIVLTKDSYPGRLSLFSQAIRYLAPLAVLFMLTGRHRQGLVFLRVGVAAVFAAHGLKALLLHPPFIAYLTVSFERALGIELSMPMAHSMVLAIGTIDVAVALLILARPTQSVLLYMFFWGALTAMMRVIYFGPEIGTSFMLVRALNGAAPLVVALWTLPPAFFATRYVRIDSRI